MIILQDSDSAQTIKFIPRSYSSTITYTVSLISETENKSVYSQNVSDSFNLQDYYREYSAIFDLKQNNFYMLEISDDSNNIIFKDKVYCTNQTVVDYSINDGVYTTHSSNNEFIIV